MALAAAALATARAFLPVERASLIVKDGKVEGPDANPAFTFGQLTKGEKLLKVIDDRVATIPADKWTVGGTAVTGGRGTVIGTLLGVVLLGAIGPALTFLGVSAQWERALQGAIILAAVAIDAARLPRGGRVVRAARMSAAAGV